jgi:hypothetical protein
MLYDAVLDEPFDAARDDHAHADSKPREDGVRDLLRARACPPAGRGWGSAWPCAARWSRSR